MSESKKVQIRTGRRGAGLNSTVAPVTPKPRPAPSKPNSGGRRGKQKPEPLPAIPDSPGSARESGLLPSRSQSSRADAQESQALANMLSDGDMPLVLVADSNSHMNPAAEGTHEPEKRRALSGGNEPDSVQTPAKQALVQRPRSTTTTPFGGRKRGIFTRPEGVQRAATTQAYAPHSSSVSPTGGDTSTWQRSHSENERLVVTRSVSGQEQAAVGTDTRAVQSATAAHFHIASGNVLNDAQKRVPRLSKRDSSMTASTVEIPESVASSLSTDRSMASNSVGQQNSRSEVFSPTSTLRRTESDVVIPSEGTRGTQVKPKVSSSVFSQSKAAGRSKRGGSGGDLRTSEFKGAAKPAASGGVFGSKQRANTGEQLQTSGHDSADLVINTSHSGPSEASSMFLSPGPDQGFGVPRNRLAATQRKGGHGAMTERSAEDYPGQNGADGKRVWLYTPPTRPTTMDLILSGAAPNNPRQGSAQQGSGEARSARMPSNQNNSPNETSQQLIGKLSGTSAMAQGASAGGKVHYRRDSATRQSSAMSGSTLFGTTGRVTSAGRVDRDHSDLADTHSTDGAQASSGGQQLLSPWAFTPTRGHKKTLVFEQPWRWNAVAPSPNKQPICAVAGHDGLVLLRMGPDQITQEAHMAMGRRWNMSMDFKDVIWRPSEYITTGSNDGTVTIWDPERRTDQLVRKFSDYSRPVNRLTPKPDNPYFVYAAYSDGYIVGWDVRASDRNSGIRLTGSLTAQDIDCTPSDASKIAAITQEGRLLVWDSRKSTTPYLNFDAHPAYRGQCIAWHPNGRFIGSGGSDQAIKVWDITTASKKFSVSPFCAIRTLAHVHKLQWRPGHDTQLSSCALSSDIRFQVWDMHNPNHSLMFHDRHKGAISGFTWYDDDVVWSSTREGDVVQCDMQNDAVFTAGLMGNIVAEFSSQHHLAVATGEFFQRKSSCIEHIMVDVSATQKRQGVVQKPGGSASGQSTFSGSANPLLAGIKNSGKMSLELLKYQTNLPQAFLDEHVLDHKLTGEPNAMAYLARTYRFDPDEFSACCEHNAKISSARFPEISRFWRFLSTMLGDSLPLKPRKRPGKSRKKETSDLQSERQLSSVGSQSSRVRRAWSRSNLSESISRASSSVFPSRSVIDSLPDGGDGSSDGEYHMPSTLMPQAPSILQSGRTSPASFSALFQSPSNRSISRGSETRFSEISETLKHAKANRLLPAVMLQSEGRETMSRSIPNLQHIMSVSTRPSNTPSPLARPLAHSMSSPSADDMALHITQNRNALRPNSVVRSRTTGSMGLSSRATELLPLTSASAQPQERAQFFFADTADIPSGVATPNLALVASGAVLPDAAPTVAPAANGVQTAAKLNIRTQRYATKKELRLVADSCQYYADKGDVQTAVTVALLMRGFIRIHKWRAVENWMLAYIDQLDQQREFEAATMIALESPFKSVRDAIETRNTVGIECCHCRSTLMQLPDTGLALCVECKRASTQCAVCQEPVIGRFVWCQGCGHGGHADHFHEWFDDLDQTECPSGCGHACNLVPGVS